MRVLTRYLLKAHIGPFLFAFVALTGVILINTLAKELANLAGKGLPLGVVAEFFVLSLPANIALTLPMAVLVAVLYTFSTLAAENEVTALRASGVDLRRAAMPLLVAGALIAGGMIWFSDQVLPAANYRWRMLMTDVAATRPLLALREQAINPIPTTDGITHYYLEAQRINASTGLMHNVAIYDVSDNMVTRTINADSGRMVMNSNQTDLLLTLFDGSVREIDFGEISSFQTVAFEQQIMRMEGVSDRLERSEESSFRTDRDMTLAMMRERIRALRRELAELEAQRAERAALAESEAELSEAQIDSLLEEDPVLAAEAEIAAARDALEEEPADVSFDSVAVEATIAAVEGDLDEDSLAAAASSGPADTLADRTATPAGTARNDVERYAATRARNIENQIREFQVEIQKKFSIPVATLVFVLIGIPIALRFPRGGIGMVIGVSLAIFGIYYVGLIGGETLGDSGFVPPAAAMWFTNAIFGLLGVIGFWRLGREQGTGRGGGWGELPRWLRKGRGTKLGRAPGAEAEAA